MDAEMPENTTSSPPKELVSEDVQMEEPTIPETQESQVPEEPVAVEAETTIMTEATTITTEEEEEEQQQQQQQQPEVSTEQVTTPVPESKTEEVVPEVKREETPTPVETTSVVESEPTKDDTENTPSTEDRMETTNEPPPFLSAPASWQIPVAALHQQPKAEVVTISKTSLRKERLESRIKENQYDIEAWTSLINDAQQTGDLDAIREIYERFLKVFPTSVSSFYSLF
ncbi:hypothetical protein BD770DRAFT_387869 [Pilaira anomala]|nr:hypothetical protein BD770DRAFT_387869 [Pilaira anomala]